MSWDVDGLARRFVRVGRLTLVSSDGERAYGDGSGPEVAVRLSRPAAMRIALNPELHLGEAYMDGGLEVLRGDVYQLLELIGRNIELNTDRRRLSPWRRVKYAAERRWQTWNDRKASRRNVAHHYDLSTELYRKVLDPDLIYSCAYFARPDMTLEEAQAAKKVHLAAKLALEPGCSVLDIGCGWGGLGLTLARDWGAQVTGITLSTEQLAVARERAEAEGLAGRARFELTDYRDVHGPFDRIVSVGMFEHVGLPNYRAYFDGVARLLADDGVAVIHAIGRKDEPSVTNPWIAKYIFPGGYIPALSEVFPAIERSGLWVTDVEVLRLHYAETLRAWRANFAARREEIAGMYDERFCRMFEFYLAVSEISFRFGGHMVFQIQLTKRVDALPLTRDYIGQTEARALGGPRLVEAARTAAE